MLLALLIMASITATGIATSVIITTTHRQSKNLSNYIGASLAADSGIERALAVLKTGRQATEMSTTLGVATTSATLPTSKATFAVTTGVAEAPKTPQTAINLNAGQSFTFDILDPGTTRTKLRIVSNFTDSAYNPVSGTWETCASTCSGGLEVAWTVISKTGSTANLNRSYPSTSGIKINLLEVRSDASNLPSTLISGSNYLGFRIKLTAMPNHNISNLKFAPCTSSCSGGDDLDLLGKVKFTSIGRDETQTSEVTKTAEVLWQPPASGFFNYVIFTEGKIEPA